MAARPQRRPKTPTDLFCDWIVSWLGSIEVDQLAGWIEDGTPMVSVLRRSIPGASGMMPFAARMLMGTPAVDAARRMDAPAFDDLLDRVCDFLPEHGLILALNREWFRHEIRKVRDAIVGR